MAIITIGIIDKKLILLVFLTILRVIDVIVSYEPSGDYFNSILCSLLEEIGPVIAGIIMNFTIKQKLDIRKEDKRNVKYPIILFLLRIIKSCYERIFPYVLTEKIYKYNAILNTTNGIEIFLISFGTFLLLKYKYYIHHMISMCIFCGLGIVNDFIIGSYFIIRYDYIYIYIIYIINEVLLFCYMKYMMDKLYYQYIEILIYWGIAGVLVKLCIFSGMIIYEQVNDIEGILNDFYIYFTETNIYGIIFLQFIYYLCYGAFYYIFIILILYYLRPNHMIISDELIVYAMLIFYQDKPNKYYTILPFILQMVALMFYFEFLEFNFWNLNINTAKNIQIREKTEIDERNTLMSAIELGDQYYLKNNETKNSEYSSYYPNENTEVNKDNLINEKNK